MLPDEVRKAVERLDNAVMFKAPNADYDAYLLIRAHLLAREAEGERLRKIEKERWDVVATRNAAVMRAEKAEALLRECLSSGLDAVSMSGELGLRDRITAHLSENTHDA